MKLNLDHILSRTSFPFYIIYILTHNQNWTKTKHTQLFETYEQIKKSSEINRKKNRLRQRERERKKMWSRQHRNKLTHKQNPTDTKQTRMKSMDKNCSWFCKWNERMCDVYVQITIDINAATPFSNVRCCFFFFFLICAIAQCFAETDIQTHKNHTQSRFRKHTHTHRYIHRRTSKNKQSEDVAIK